MKKLAAIILLIIFTLTPLMQTLATDESVSISIESATKTALETSKQLVINDFEIKVKESALKDAKDNIGKQNRYTTWRELLDNRIKEEVKPLEAEVDLTVAKRNKEADATNIKISIYNSILQYILIQKELEAEQKKLSIYQEKLNILNTQFKSGKIAESDLLDSQYDIESRKVTVGNIELKLQFAGIEIKKLLGLPMNDTPLSIVDELLPAALESISVDTLLEKVLKNDTGIYQGENSVIFKTKILEFTKEHFKEGETIYEQNSKSLELAKANLADIRLKVETELKNKYNYLLNAKDRLDLSEKYLNLVKKKLKNAETKFKNGVISKTALLNQQEALINAEYQRYSAVYDYNIKSFEFTSIYGK
ncbi:MAG: TolC family protein [Clostridia bacterium]|nr:TolC family protein [Clostridia bacterium]